MHTQNTPTPQDKGVRLQCLGRALLCSYLLASQGYLGWRAVVNGGLPDQLMPQWECESLPCAHWYLAISSSKCPGLPYLPTAKVGGLWIGWPILLLTIVSTGELRDLLSSDSMGLIYDRSIIPVYQKDDIVRGLDTSLAYQNSKLYQRLNPNLYFITYPNQIRYYTWISDTLFNRPIEKKLQHRLISQSLSVSESRQ